MIRSSNQDTLVRIQQDTSVYLYEMLRIRLVEERIVELYPQQQMRCPVHLCIGQEAVSVGVSKAITQNDFVLSNHRAHGHYLAKGGSLKAMFAEMYGKATGCCLGRGGSMHLIDRSVNFLGSTPIVGGSIPVATGVAFSEWLKQGTRITICYLGDAAVEEGVFHESLNFASLKQLPIIYVCENNLYSVYTPLSQRQPQRDLSELARGHQLLTIKDDGNDVFRVHDAAREAVEHIRAGKGPVFLEFPTYRFREHCGPNLDNDLGYRAVSEYEQWQSLCPIHRLQDYALKEGILDQDQIQVMKKEISDEIDEAVDFAKKSPFPVGSNSRNEGYAS